MSKQSPQRFTNSSTGRREDTVSLTAGHEGAWHADARPVLTPSDPALEAAMRPFLQDLTVKEREAIAVFFAEDRPSEREAAATLGIKQGPFQRRLYGVQERHRPGALNKVREAILSAVPPDLLHRLEDELDKPEEDRDAAVFADLRRWLTPAENIRADGTEDPWQDARCLVCSRKLAKWRPNTIASGLARFEESRLVCADHWV